MKKQYCLFIAGANKHLSLIGIALIPGNSRPGGPGSPGGPWNPRGPSSPGGPIQSGAAPPFCPLGPMIPGAPLGPAGPRKSEPVKTQNEVYYSHSATVGPRFATINNYYIGCIGCKLLKSNNTILFMTKKVPGNPGEPGKPDTP